MGAQPVDRTRERILAVTLELFAQQGYAGTSIAHIADRLGFSKAALYYHFKSKEEVLDAILTSSLTEFASAGERAAAGHQTPEELLGAVIDLTVVSGALRAAVGGDPSVLAVQAQRSGLPATEESAAKIISALAGPDADRTRHICAHAAFAIARHGTVSVLQAYGGSLSDEARTALLESAVRALSPGAVAVPAVGADTGSAVGVG